MTSDDVYLLTEELQWDNERTIGVFKTLEGAQQFLPDVTWHKDANSYYWRGRQRMEYRSGRNLYIVKQVLHP